VKGPLIDLLIIDPQNDFMDIFKDPSKPYRQAAALPVVGALKDMDRLAAFITRAASRINDVHVTLDTHRLFDVSHPYWWEAVNPGSMNPTAVFEGTRKGVFHPMPGTQFEANDVGPGKTWMPFNRTLLPRMMDYLQKLEAGGKYKHTIWPPHCLIGTWGHNVEKNVATALKFWEETQQADINYVTKGSNPFTEHFGAVEAEVPDPSDPGTQLNTNLINLLASRDVILMAGEALSHCVKSTVEGIANNFGDDNIKKLVLLEDCSSPVIIPGVIDFTPHAQKFVMEMKQRGMRVAKSTEYLS
jgi:nicotinamidase/pyrazinamidase